MNDLPETAPRGKLFAVTWQSHVVHTPAIPIHDIVGTKRFELRLHAERAAREIDWRLHPTIVLVPKE